MRALGLTVVLSAVSMLVFEVKAWVCYQWHEPDPHSEGLQHRWHFPENPAKCTEIRLGGVNTMPDYHLQQSLTTEETQIGKNEMSTRPAELCFSIATEGNWNPYKSVYPGPEQGQFNSPLERLEFTVQTSAGVAKLYLQNADTRNVYYVELGPYSSAIRRWNVTVWDQVAAADAEFSGRLWLTYNNGEIQVGGNGSNAPLMRFQDNSSPHQEIRRIKLYSSQHAEWQIYAPCY